MNIIRSFYLSIYFMQLSNSKKINEYHVCPANNKMSMSNHLTINKMSMDNLDTKTIMQTIRIFRPWIFDYKPNLFALWIIFLELCYLWLTLYDETSTIYVMLEFEIKYGFYFFLGVLNDDWLLLT